MKAENPIPLSRRKREYERHRQEILNAAVELFMEKGFDKTTMQDIAERAEFAVGSLYRFFKNKKALFDELLLDIWRKVDQKLSLAFEHPGDELEKLRAYNRVCVELMIEHEVLARIYMGQTGSVVLDNFAVSSSEIRDIQIRYQRRLEELFRSGIEHGLFVPLNPRILALGYDGMIGAYFFSMLDNESTVEPAQWIEQTERIFFESVLVQK